MIKRFLTYLTIMCFSWHILAVPLWAGVLSPSSFAKMYALAAKGNKEALFEARYRGLNIDSVNENGDTGLCMAVKRRNVKAFNTFRAVGANVRHPCTQRISYYNAFLNKSSVRNANFFAKNYAHIQSTSNKKTLLYGAGILGAGAALYFLLDHGGGGGDDDTPRDPCAGVTCPVNGHCVSGSCACDEGFVQINGQCLESSSVCNGHGVWNAQEGVCTCETGYNADKKCSDCVKGYVLFNNKCAAEQDVCYNGGTWNDVHEKCDCKPNFDSERFCEICVSGYKLSGGSCVEDKDPELIGDCNSHGTWDSAMKKCSCDTGWNPDNNCRTCANLYVSVNEDGIAKCYLASDLCNNHGAWNQKENKCMCEGGYVGESCGECAENYEKDSSGICFLPTGNCNNHGTWNGKSCDCDTGWNSEKNCSECQKPEYVLYNEKCAPMSDLCDGQGSWNETLQDCKCNAGYQVRDKVHCDPVAAAAAIGLSVEDDVNLDDALQTGDERVARALALVRKISVTQEEEADAYGVKAGGKVSAGSGHTYLINVENKSETGDAYGIEAKSVDLSESYGGITAKGNADVYGIKAKEDVSSKWNIHSQTNGKGEAYGIYADASGSQDKHNLKNTGEIKVDGENAETLAGIYAKNYDVDNSGKITVEGGDKTKAYGIYADHSNVVNSGEITVDGGAGSYGIYGQNHSSVLNTGKITLNGEMCEGENCEKGKQIGLDETSVLMNSGQIQSTGALDFNKIGGSVLLAKGGSFEAESLSGKLGIASDVVSDGFKNEYVEENVLKGEDKGLEVESNSAMFKASKRSGTEEGSSDVVMDRESFENLSQSQSIADYLEANYQEEKNEELFKKLKSAPTRIAYEKAEAETLGTELIPNFSQENMRVLRNLNATLTDDLFNTEGKERKIVGYDYQYSERGDKGTLTGYENYANTMYFMYDKELENMLYAGLGMGITQFRSDYENDSSRKEMMVQVFAPIGYNFGNGLKWQSIGRLGYSDGSYDRRTSSGTFESDLTSWIYGISNALRYSKDLGFATLEPEAQLNILGYYQNRIREDANKSLALRADGANNLSVESGFGLFIKRNMAINEYSKLKMKIGGMWYHEFANPYHSLSAQLNGTVGKYKLRDRNGIYNRNRGVLRADVEYDWHSFTFYIVYRQYLEDEDPMAINAGVKYKF